MKASFIASFALLLLAGLAPHDAFALTISPTKLEVAGDPGQSIIGEIELFNEQDETKTFFTTFENFEPRGETGAPFFVGAGTGLATWLGAQGSVEIAPGERVTVPYTITIPGDALAGGYFAAVFFGSQPPAGEQGGEVSIGGKVGTLVLLRVNGPIEESGGVLEFGTTDSQRFFTAIPLTFSYRFNNTGGDRVVPKGEIVVTNTIGMKSVTLSANQTEGSILPNSIRRFETQWLMADAEGAMSEKSFLAHVMHQVKNFHVGFYKAELSLQWGDTNQKAVESFRFVLFPWQLLIVAFGGLVVLYFGFRSYNRMIIARAKRS